VTADSRMENFNNLRDDDDTNHPITGSWCAGRMLSSLSGSTSPASS